MECLLEYTAVQIMAIYFLKMRSHILNFNNYIKYLVFPIKSVKVIDNEKPVDISYQYYLTYLLRQLQKYMDNSIVQTLINKLTISGDKIEITQEFINSGLRKIIFQTPTSQTDIIKYGQDMIANNIEHIDTNQELCSNCIVKKYSVNGTDLKNYLFDYYNFDRSNNTIGNVLSFNNIEYSEESEICLELYTFKTGIKRYNYKLIDNLDLNINFVYYLNFQ